MKKNHSSDFYLLYLKFFSIFFRNLVKTRENLITREFQSFISYFSRSDEQIVTETSMQINREAAAISLSSVCKITAECGQAGSNIALSSWK